MLIGQVRAHPGAVRGRRAGFVLGRGRTLGMTQSAVSQHVAALEREAGLPLVDRGTRPVELTEAGAVLVRHGRTVTAQLDDAEQALAEISGRRAGRLRLGSFPTALTTFVPDGARPVARGEPRASSSPSSTTTCRGCSRGSSSGELDLAVVYENPVLPGRRARRLTPRAAVRRPLPGGAARRATGSPGGARGSRWPTWPRRSGWAVVPAAPGSGSCCTPAARAGFEPRTLLTTDDYRAVHAFVAAGLGIGGGPRTRRRAPARPASRCATSTPAGRYAGSPSPIRPVSRWRHRWGR